MTIRKIKVKANAMENADVSFISLVTRPASRIPFRVMKSDDDPQEGDFMFNLTKLFKQDGEPSQSTDCILAAVVLQKKHEAHFAPKLKELGLKTDDRVEKEDVVILRQVPYAEDDVTTIKLNEMGGLFLNAPESVQKGFDPFPEGTDFAENFSQGAFLPGVSIATEVMMETMRNVLRTAENQSVAREGIDGLMTAYKDHVLSFVDDLPEVAFRIDELNLEGFVAVQNQDEGDGALEDDPTGDANEEAGDAGEAGTADESADQSEAASDESGDGNGGEGAGSEEAQKAEDGLTDEERAVLKGVHIEDLDVAGDDASGDTASKSTEASDAEKKSTEKSDESELDIVALIGTMKSEVLEAVSGVRTEVKSLKEEQDKLAAKVDETAEIAESARKAVKGTVPSNSDSGDEIPDESLGTHRSKAEDGTEKLWSGTSLDRIVGNHS
jgi:hypothetical protein